MVIASFSLYPFRQIVADNLSKDLSGSPPLKTPTKLASFYSVFKGINFVKEFFGFKFFSPSSEAVSMKAAPSEDEVFMIRSAGNIS